MSIHPKLIKRTVYGCTSALIRLSNVQPYPVLPQTLVGQRTAKGPWPLSVRTPKGTIPPGLPVVHHSKLQTRQIMNAKRNSLRMLYVKTVLQLVRTCVIHVKETYNIAVSAPKKSTGIVACEIPVRSRPRATWRTGLGREHIVAITVVPSWKRLSWGITLLLKGLSVSILFFLISFLFITKHRLRTVRSIDATACNEHGLISSFFHFTAGQCSKNTASTKSYLAHQTAWIHGAQKWQSRHACVHIWLPPCLQEAGKHIGSTTPSTIKSSKTT